MKYVKPSLYSVSPVSAAAQCANGSSPSVDNSCGSGGGVGSGSCTVGHANLFGCIQFGYAAVTACNSGTNVNQACAVGGTN